MVRSVVEDGPVHGCQSAAVNLLQSHRPHVARQESMCVCVCVCVCVKDALLITHVFSQSLHSFTRFDHDDIQTHTQE